MRDIAGGNMLICNTIVSFATGLHYSESNP